MSKAVLISIRPAWCEKIICGDKTIEARKTRPKIDTPFKCYIYCTRCGEILSRGLEILNGMVIGEFTCDKVCDLHEVDREATCMTMAQWQNYTAYYRNIVYGWHISDFEIYDKPRKLCEFNKSGFSSTIPLTHPPQSWCYVEEL